MTRARLVAALLAVLALVLSGCASISDQSQPQPIKNMPANDPGLSISGPPPGVDQYTLAGKFVQANAEASGNYRVPRAFLTPDRARQWNPRAKVTVVDDEVATEPRQTVPGDANVQTVRLRAVKLGTLGPDGSFSPAQRKQDYTQDLTLVRQPDNQWRIKYVADGLVIRQSDFRRAYQQASLSFVEPRLQAPIPDVRYFPRGSPTRLAARIVNGLISGPSTALRPAVKSNFGTIDPKAKATVEQTGPGALTVDLPPVGNAQPAVRKGMVDQIVRSLRGVAGGSIQVRSGGRPLDPSRPTTEFSDLPTYSLFQPSKEAVPLYIQGALLKALPRSGQQGADPGEAGKQIESMTGVSDCSATSGGRSLDGEQLALVCRTGDGRVALRAGQFGKGVGEVPGSQARSLTRPTWPPGSPASNVGYEVWTVANGSAVKRVHREGDQWTVSDVDASQVFTLEQLGGSRARISELRLSRDGVRAALVVGGHLVVCSVQRDGEGEARLVAPTVITNGLDNVQDVDWTSQTDMAVISGSDSEKLSKVSVDGLYSTESSTTNMSPPLTSVSGAQGQPLLVVASGTTFTATPSGGSWIPLDLNKNARPFYAG